MVQTSLAAAKKIIPAYFRCMISQKTANLKRGKVLPATENPFTLCRVHPPMGGGKAVASVSFGQRYAWNFKQGTMNKTKSCTLLFLEVDGDFEFNWFTQHKTCNIVESLDHLTRGHLTESGTLWTTRELWIKRPQMSKTTIISKALFTWNM